MNHSLPIRDPGLVESLIPQKSPMVMVDTLWHYDALTLQAGLSIKEENIFVQYGLLQAAGLIEHQAQSVALHTGYQYFLKGVSPPTGYIGAIKSFQIDRLPKVGSQIYTEVSIISELMGVTLVDIKTKVNNTVIAIAQMKTVLKS